MSQVLPQDWVVVPLAKFSHNTCSAGTRNIVWSHVSLRDDLDIVFQNSKFVDGFGNVVNRIIMKITAGSELLETQDLGDLVRICRSMPETTAGADHPVQIVVKSPFLAVRYPQHPNHVRRIQVKLKNDADFMKVKSILEDLGLPIFSSAPTSSTSVPPAQARRPSISPAPSIFSSVSSSTLGHAPSGRPSPFKVPLLPDNAQRPASNPSYFTNQGPSRTSSAFAMPTLGDPFTEATPGASMNRMPSLYLSQMERQVSITSLLC
ncbi:hypothetical protein BJ878DRAFT_428510 [Calycina marina]|uniref:Uncharacterized protein n=1 Tax=Calycina marina TaxID=1763456 RepID=A0A9P8CC40_9HELO|nr:hypothetical protein BJ878DRAFT_428510 [Calycina marina]